MLSKFGDPEVLKNSGNKTACLTFYAIVHRNAPVCTVVYCKLKCLGTCCVDFLYL